MISYFLCWYFSIYPVCVPFVALWQSLFQLFCKITFGFSSIASIWMPIVPLVSSAHDFQSTKQWPLLVRHTLAFVSWNLFTAVHVVSLVKYCVINFDQSLCILSVYVPSVGNNNIQPTITIWIVLWVNVGFSSTAIWIAVDCFHQ